MASIQDQLNRIIVNKVKLRNGKTVKQNLMEAVDYLYICMQNRIDEMYESYTPKIYERRSFLDGLQTSLYAEDFIDSKIVGNTIYLSLKFSGNVWAWNFNNNHKSPVNVLMNEGWIAPKLEKQIGHPVERFTRFEGAKFIQKGISDFNKHNKWGVRITWDIDSGNWY